MSKYSALRDFLLSTGKDVVVLSFNEIAEIIGSELPLSAFKHRAWWANDRYHTHARNGWLAAGYIVSHVDFDKQKVVFVKAREKQGENVVGKVLSSPTRVSSSAGISAAVRNAREFEELARRIMSKYFGVKLSKGKKPGWPKEFDLVSPDFKIVGDVKYYTMVRGTSLPPAKFATIAEHVWMLENIEADIKFLVFGNDKRVPLKWLEKYGYLVKSVKFYFINNDGKVEELL